MPGAISSRTPSTGLGHPSALILAPAYLVSPSSPGAVAADSKFSRSSVALAARGAAAGTATIFSTAAAKWPGDRCAYRFTMLRARHPPSSWTVRKSTPAATRREAKVCLSACQVTPSRRAASSSLPADRSVARAACASVDYCGAV